MKKYCLISLISFLLFNCSIDEVEPLPLVIEGVTESEAKVGDIISINGRNFIQNQTYSVWFNNIQGSITDIHKDFIKVKIPEKSTSGTITLNYNLETIQVGNITIENIFRGNLKLTTQKEIDEFGANNYTQFIGDIQFGDTITPSESITNLLSLKHLKSITGYLHIINLKNLTSLNGLHKLNNIRGNLKIQDLENLTNLEGLESLKKVGCDFIIQNNNSLINLHGINNIETVGRHLVIFMNKNLNSIKGFENLSSVGKDLILESNPMLYDVNGLNNLTTIGRLLSIYDNASLVNINDLDGLTSIDFLLIKKNNSLSNFCGLQNLISNKEIADNYEVSENLYNPSKQNIIEESCSN